MSHEFDVGLAGFLQPSRVRKLEQVGVNWQPTCTDANRLWDAHLTQLITFRKEHGHVQVCLTKRRRMQQNRYLSCDHVSL